MTTFYSYLYVSDSIAQHEEKEVKIVDLDAHGTAVITLQPPNNCSDARVEVIFQSIPILIHTFLFQHFCIPQEVDEKRSKFYLLIAYISIKFKKKNTLFSFFSFFYNNNKYYYLLQAHYDRSGKDNFKDASIYSILYIEAGKSPSNNFLQLIADHTGVVDTGKTLSFTVKATEPLSTITYQVVNQCYYMF